MSAPQSYYVPVDAGEAEFTEKRSRFLGHVRRVETEAEARAFLDEMRKKYYDARHNCWCYVLHEGGVVRYGDDGEPQGTAGQPMLNVFQREGVENVVCVVTRYFGGVLLGTGGLVRAYQGAVQAGLASSTIIDKKEGIQLTVGMDYTGLGKLQYLFGQKHTVILDTAYEADVTMIILVPAEQKEILPKEITELTNGSAGLEWGKTCVYALIDKEVVFF